MTTQITIIATDANFVPPYAVHESTRQRNRAGEKVGEIEVQFIPVPSHRFTACRLQFDERTILLLESKGIFGASDMVGKSFTIESDAAEDLLMPWRLISIN